MRPRTYLQAVTTLIPLVSLLVYTFGAIAFGELCLFWLRGHRTTRLDAPAITSGVLIVVSALWFVLNAASVLADLAHGGPYYLLYTVLLFQSALFAPLLMQITYFEHRELLTSRTRWKIALIAAWMAAAIAMTTIAATRFLPSNRLVVIFFVTLCSLFVAAGAFNVLIAAATKRARVDVNTRRNRAADIVLWVFATFLVAFGLLGGPDTWMPGANALFQIVLRSIPLYFLIVGTYYKRRIAFYDIFVKRGALILSALTLLMIYFAVAAPVVARFPIGRAAVWVDALTLLPLIVVTPWLNHRIQDTIDRHWLGRRFTAAGATTYLFEGLQTASSEQELIQQAEGRLSEIFQAPVTVTFDDVRGHSNHVAAMEFVREMPIEFQGEEVGRVRLGPRRAGATYLSQDLSLAASLAGVIGSMFENVRLQARRREQLALEQELRLHASKAELKALRAQINPHFLFNALNAIVALIPTRPDRAEETLEQLAEVFRYTLTRSDKEWTRLADEVAFVRAYLDVEKARFGDRLQATIEIDAAAGEMKVPSMMLQTLVENAVKHGLASVRGIGELSIEARVNQNRLRLIVRDNGPDTHGGTKTVDSRPRTGEGYGLRNIRERLTAHFGERANFSLTRDATTATTVAAIELPVDQ